MLEISVAPNHKKMENSWLEVRNGLFFASQLKKNFTPVNKTKPVLGRFNFSAEADMLQLQIGTINKQIEEPALYLQLWWISEYQCCTLIYSDFV